LPTSDSPAVSHAPIVTAALRPELFAEPGSRAPSRRFVVLALVVLTLAALGLRAYGLSAEGLSEDELNKLQAVEDYRAHGLTSANGEHPLLMKAMQMASVVAVEWWNESVPAAREGGALNVPLEGALRFPGALLGALTTVLIYLVMAELFGAEAALVAAALWALDPAAVGFNRIAKEDTFFVFFFLLACVFWLRSQTVAEGGEGRSPGPYYLLTGAALGAMMASKYILHFVAIPISYNYAFQGLPNRRWQIGRPRYLRILLVMCAVFLLCNPSILLPGTWRQMQAFASYQHLGHDSLEFMGRLYSHKATDWLNGVPWYFYFVFLWVKLPPLTVAAFLVGLAQLFRRRAGDGRYFLIFWLFFWAMGFTFLGGKFTRYFTTALPAVLMTAALGMQASARYLSRGAARLFGGAGSNAYVRAALMLLVALGAVYASLSAAPYYRLYTNTLAGRDRAGEFFPHDEFYDGGTRQAVFEVAKRAGEGARIASETPGLADFYADRAGRTDIDCVSLSDDSDLKELRAGDFILVARGRRYRSNDALLSALHGSRKPDFTVSLGGVRAVEIYEVDQSTLTVVADATRQASDAGLLR
jgi:Dolichyl-phosphate-mannose-protein mannosyltransferase